MCKWIVSAAVLLAVLATARGDGPSDPEFDPDVMKLKPADNVHVGGPYDDWLTGYRVWWAPHYYWAKGGKDLLDTQQGNDVMWGGDGDDGLYGEDGNDILMGGAGNDYLVGGPGRDILYGDDGDDNLDGDPCGKGNTCSGPGIVYDDWMHGGNGNDFMIGRFGNDEMYGGPGDDKMRGNDGNDYLDGGDGNDMMWSDAGDDYLYGGNGDDSIWGGSGVDILYGGPGNDMLHGRDPAKDGHGSNAFVVDARCGETDNLRYFMASEGDSVMIVTGANNRRKQRKSLADFTVKIVKHQTGIYMTGCATPIATFSGQDFPVKDVLKNFSVQPTAPPIPSWVVGWIPQPVPGQNGVPLMPGDNVLQGTGLSDNLTAPQDSTAGAFMWGGPMYDTLTGGPGPDCIIGENHDDLIFGGDGDDRLSGSSGYDVIWGQGGRDALFGGHNKDILYGGGWGNWITGGDSTDQIYVDAPASCAATGPQPDILNDFDTDQVYIVGNLNSASQLSIAVSNGDTLISLQGCNTPFFRVKGVTNFPTSNIFFTTTVPKAPLKP